jgi:acyl-CoA dehydrogenase
MTHTATVTPRIHVQRYLRESMIARIVPVTPHLILGFIAERLLGLPQSH